VRATREDRRYTEGLAVFEEWQLARYHGDTSVRKSLRRIPMGVKYLFLSHYWGKVPPARLWARSLKGPRTLPDFACVGALKSGTTDLASYLMQHPSILAPLTKEIWHSHPEQWRVFYPTERERKRVERTTGQAISGHFPPLLHDLALIDNFKAARPDAKVVLLLRDPVARAYSHYKWDIFIGGKNGVAAPYTQSYAQYVDLALSFFPGPTPPTTLPSIPMLQTGIYVNSVRLWLDRFGRDNVHIVRAEDFFQDIRGTVCGVHEFLGLPPVEPKLHHVLNQNPLKFPDADDTSVTKLREFYKPWNAELYELLGADLGWDK
jgi:hypothetical protein